jgi:AraC-like DNA-binding protein
MQTTLVETGSRTEMESIAFSSRNDLSDMPMKRDAVFKPNNSSFATLSQGNGFSSNRVLIEAMVNSRIYQEYEKAFSEATGIPVALRPVESQELSANGNRNETSVPVRLGDRLIGFLEAGDACLKSDRFGHTAKLTGQWDLAVDRTELDKTFFETEAVSTRQQESVVKLLSVFAQHLSMLSNQVVMQQENSEPLVITRARDYIHAHQTEDLSLGQVAKAVNTSTFYFCKLFKKVTGINFTDYLSRVRIEKARNLLLNRNLRVSEIAFEVGFQSLTHFNRVFKKILGQSPTEYRAQLLGH